jgi:beta-glucosidase
MSDWVATESTISAITGLDMTMPGDITLKFGDSYFGKKLTAYVINGTIPEARIDDMAVRYEISRFPLKFTTYSYTFSILAGWYFLGQDSGTQRPTSMLGSPWTTDITSILTSGMTTGKSFARSLLLA